LANAGSIVTVNTTINNAGTNSNLTVAGGGTVKLPTANNLGTGSTALDGGTTPQLRNTAGTGPRTLGPNTCTPQTQSTTGLALRNAVTLNNASVTLGGTNPLLFTAAGSVTLNGINNTLAVTNTALTNINSVISGTGNLTKTGAGTLILSGANTYVGQT